MWLKLEGEGVAVAAGSIGPNLSVGRSQMLLLFGWLFELVTALRVPAQLQQDAEEVHAVHKDDKNYRAIKCSDARLPRHPATNEDRDKTIQTSDVAFFSNSISGSTFSIHLNLPNMLMVKFSLIKTIPRLPVLICRCDY